MQHKIMFLEDEDVLGKIYRKKLESEGYKILWVKTVDEAEKQVQGFQPDLVLLDHAIRGKERSGIDLIPLLRSMLPQAKIIMLSNYSAYDMQEAAMKAGADGYLVKINMPPKALVEYLGTLFA